LRSSGSSGFFRVFKFYCLK